MADTYGFKIIYAITLLCEVPLRRWCELSQTCDISFEAQHDFLVRVGPCDCRTASSVVGGSHDVETVLLSVRIELEQRRNVPFRPVDICAFVVQPFHADVWRREQHRSLGAGVRERESDRGIGRNAPRSSANTDVRRQGLAWSGDHLPEPNAEVFLLRFDGLRELGTPCLLVLFSRADLSSRYRSEPFVPRCDGVCYIEHWCPDAAAVKVTGTPDLDC
jgi:hypothetical protein